MTAPDQDPAASGELVALRRALHAAPETAFAEQRTARRIALALRAATPDEVVEGLGGTGVAAAWGRPAPGESTILVRAELDGLPVTERSGLPHASEAASRSHACGHDGHMTILVGLARALAGRRPRRGRVVLLFQPAEETGQGAARVLADPAFAPLFPDRAFALHNLPGFALGAVLVRPGPFASASCGLDVTLRGRSAHAGHPDQGRSPAGALAALIRSVPALPSQTVPYGRPALATVVGATLGGRAFGTSPGDATLQATLRAARDDDLAALLDRTEALARGVASAHGLAIEIARVEPFAATVNDPDAVRLVEAAAGDASLTVNAPDGPFPWSEDFGRIAAALPGALFGLGSGIDHPPLHAPDYDFPDALVPVGVRLLRALVDRALAPSRT